MIKTADEPIVTNQVKPVQLQGSTIGNGDMARLTIGC